MHGALTTYFDGEKSAGLFVAGLGLVVLVAAAVLFPARYELRAFAITLAVFGLVELAVGVGLFVKTGPQVTRLAAQLASDPAAFFAAEAPRMARVQRNFVYLEYLWLTLIAGAAATAIFVKHRPTVNGVALGVLMNAAAFLCFDLVAERRGAVYCDAVSQRPDGGANPAGPSSAGAPSPT